MNNKQLCKMDCGWHFISHCLATILVTSSRSELSLSNYQLTIYNMFDVMAYLVLFEIIPVLVLKMDEKRVFIFV